MYVWLKEDEGGWKRNFNICLVYKIKEMVLKLREIFMDAQMSFFKN